MSAPSPRRRRPRPRSGPHPGSGPARHRGGPGDGPPGPDHLLQILAGLDPFVVLAFRSARGHTDVSVRQVRPDPRCGAAALFGLRTPAGCQVVGASFLGVARGDGDEAPGPELRIDVAVARDGTVRSTLRDPGSRSPTPGAVEPTDGPVDGRVVDALHRVLGLASPGAPPPLEDLVIGLWMARVVDLLAREPGAPSWAAVAGCHPDALDDHRRPGALPPSPEALAGATTALTAGENWARMRRSAVAGRFPAPELDPDEAAWMDTTLFARWMVESFPPAGRVVAALRAAGGHAAADGIDGVAHLLTRPAEVA